MTLCSYLNVTQGKEFVVAGLCCACHMLRDRSLITGRGEVTKEENRGSETVCPLPPRQNLSRPPFEGWKLIAPPPFAHIHTPPPPPPPRLARN